MSNSPHTIDLGNEALLDWRVLNPSGKCRFRFRNETIQFGSFRPRLQIQKGFQLPILQMRRFVFMIPLAMAIGCSKPAGQVPPVTPTATATPAQPVAPAVPLGNVTAVPFARIQFQPTADYEMMAPSMWRHREGQGQINFQYQIGTVEAEVARLLAMLQGTGSKMIETAPLPPTAGGLTRRLIANEGERSRMVKIDEWRLLIGKDRWITTVKFRGTPAMAAAIRAMAMSVDGIPGDMKPLDSLNGFHLAESPLLKTAQMAAWVDYTLTGTMKLESAADPLLCLKPNVAGKATEKEALADEYLNSIYAIANVKVTSRKPIELAGMSGFETEATATKGEAANPVDIYHVVLFRPAGTPGQGQLTVHGTVGADYPDKQKILAEFRRMAHGVTKE